MDVSLRDIWKIKEILSTAGLHEALCGRRLADDAVCDCWVSEDDFEMQAAPPIRVETSNNIAESTRTHLYGDGRKRHWRRDHPGFGKNNTNWVEVFP